MLDATRHENKVGSMESTQVKKTFKELGLKYLSIELNNTCNLKCTFCPISIPELQQQEREKLLDKERVFKILDEVAADGTLEYVVLNNYGEPFLYPYFEEILKYCHDRNIRMRFATNGTMFSKKNLDLLRKYQPEEIVLSVQYFYEKDYEIVKGTKISRDKWLKMVGDFLRMCMDENLGIRVQIAIAMNASNTKLNRVLGLRLGDTNLPYPSAKYFKDLKEWTKNFVENCVEKEYDEKFLSLSKDNWGYNRYYSISDKISIEVKNFFDSTNFYQFEEIDKVSCELDYLIVNSEGKVVMCCAEYQGDTSIGKVYQNEKNTPVKDVLVKRHKMFKNIDNEKAKLAICRKCKGERTKRGLFLRKIKNTLFGA